MTTAKTSLSPAWPSATSARLVPSRHRISSSFTAGVSPVAAEASALLQQELPQLCCSSTSYFRLHLHPQCLILLVQQGPVSIPPWAAHSCGCSGRHTLDTELLLPSPGAPLLHPLPTVRKLCPVPGNPLDTREQLCCWQGIRKFPISEDFSKHPIPSHSQRELWEHHSLDQQHWHPWAALSQNCTSLIPALILPRLREVLVSQPAQP